MGYAGSWIACKGISPKRLRKRMGLVESGKFEKFPESDVTGAQIGSFYVVVGLGEATITLSEYLFETLARDCQIVFFNAEEHVMFCTVLCWKWGHKKWSVTHDSSSARDHLEEYGKLPPEYSAIRNRLFEQQRKEDTDHPSGIAEVDYVFEIPVELAHAVTGFRYDVVGPPFEVLHFEQPKELTWLQRLWYSPLLDARPRRPK